MKLLEVKGVSKRFYSNQALKGVDLSVDAGQIMALAGENGAGKSTLMNILLGSIAPDAGQMWFDGRPYAPRDPQEALRTGISMIHQELELVPSLTVAENIWIGREHRFRSFGLYSRRKSEDAAAALLGEMGVALSPRALVKTLSVAQMQMVELARALSYNARLVIMDEPTSSLSDKEVAVLYRVVRDLAAKGKAVIFISHKLEEIFQIADRVTVFRDGQMIASQAVADTRMNDLIAMIAGRRMENLYPKEPVELGGEVFRAEGIGLRGVFQDVSFSVRQGEILGFAGLVGAGRTEIMNAIFGVTPLDTGQLYMDGKPLRCRSPHEAIRNGIGMVTEDRLRRGVIRKLSVKWNMTLAYFDRICRLFFIDQKREQRDAQAMAEDLQVKTAGLDISIGSLSGGNQQKVMIGCALLTHPKLLILDEPTRGVDVGAKHEIYLQCGRLAREGHAILLISSELGEVMGMSDRILVVREGRIVGEHLQGAAGEQTIIAEMFGLGK